MPSSGQQIRELVRTAVGKDDHRTVANGFDPPHGPGHGHEPGQRRELLHVEELRLRETLARDIPAPHVHGDERRITGDRIRTQRGTGHLPELPADEFLFARERSEKTANALESDDARPRRLLCFRIDMRSGCPSSIRLPSVRIFTREMPRTCSAARKKPA